MRTTGFGGSINYERSAERVLRGLVKKSKHEGPDTTRPVTVLTSLYLREYGSDFLAGFTGVHSCNLDRSRIWLTWGGGGRVTMTGSTCRVKGVKIGR